MTKQYELILIDVTTGKSKLVDVFDIEHFYENEYDGSGICLFFDGRGDLSEVMASEEGILDDAEESANNLNHYFYALITDEENVYESYLMFREGKINISSIDLPLSMQITMTNN